MPSLINSFTAVPSTIVTGGISILRWDTVEGSTVTLTNYGTVENVGIRYAKPTVTTEYTLQAKEGVYTSTQRLTVIVGLVPPPEHGGAIISSDINPVSISPGESTTISGTGKNIGNVTEYFIMDIWSGTHESYWTEWKLLDPGETMDHSRTVRNITEDETFYIILWRWDGSDSVRCHELPVTVFVVEIIDYTLTVKTIPTYCHVEVDDQWVTNSGDDGTSVFPNLPEGNHTIVVSKSGLDPQTVTIDLIEDREITINISAPPDFWTDPVGWIQYFVISTLDNLLQWQGGSFVTLLQDVKSFFDNSWTQIAAFFSDVSQGVKDALGSTLTGIQDWLDSSFNNIGEWWDSTTSDIGEWWNSTTEDVGNWWISVSGEIGDWWTGSIEDLNDAIANATEGFLSWGEDLLTDIWEGIQDWVIDLITGLIESFNTGFDQGIEDQKTERGYNEE